MVDLPQRFVPTSSRLIRHDNAVLQCGHDAPVVCVKFSPNLDYLASADARGTLILWAIETLDVLGVYHLDFLCEKIEWRRSGQIACCGSNGAVGRVIGLGVEEGVIFPEGAGEPDMSRVIRFIGSPEIEILPDKCEIRYGDEVFSHAQPGLVRAEIEPCERYAVAVSPHELCILSATVDEVLLRLTAPEGALWCDFVVSGRGDFVVALLDNSTVYHIDPVKLRTEIADLRHGHITTADMGNDVCIAYGNETGNIGVYQIARRVTCLRTPRKPPDFVASYPSPEKFGFIGLRPESATAFLGASNEILPCAPLPAVLTASCAGSAASEFIASCADGHIYRIQPDSGAIRRIADTDSDVVAICATGESRAFCNKSGDLYVFSGFARPNLIARSIRAPKKLAVSENASLVACLYDDEIVVYGVKKSAAEPGHISVSHCADIAFGREKPAQSLILLNDDLSVGVLSLKDASVSTLCRVDIPFGTYISHASAPKSALFVLYEGEQGHKIVVKISIKTGTVTEVLRILSCGRQIWAAAVTPEMLLLRNDVSMVKIVSGFKAYSIEDWTRSEPLSEDRSAAY